VPGRHPHLLPVPSPQDGYLAPSAYKALRCFKIIGKELAMGAWFFIMMFWVSLILFWAPTFLNYFSKGFAFCRWFKGEHPPVGKVTALLAVLCIIFHAKGAYVHFVFALVAALFSALFVIDGEEKEEERFTWRDYLFFAACFSVVAFGCISWYAWGEDSLPVKVLGSLFLVLGCLAFLCSFVLLFIPEEWLHGKDSRFYRPWDEEKLMPGVSRE
jgi:hypothetical protein